MVNTDKSILNRIKKAMSIGKFSGLFYVSLIILDCLYFLLLVLLYPAKNMNKEKNFDYKKYKQITKSL